MSKTVTGVIDMPFVDLSDLHTIYDLLQFLSERGLLNLNMENVKLTENKLRVEEGTWHWLEIYKDRTLKFDDMYMNRKNEILSAIQEYYPQFKTAKDIVEKNKLKKYEFHYDEEKEELVVEVEL